MLHIWVSNEATAAASHQPLSAVVFAWVLFINTDLENMGNRCHTYSAAAEGTERNSAPLLKTFARTFQFVLLPVATDSQRQILIEGRLGLCLCAAPHQLGHRPGTLQYMFKATTPTSLCYSLFQWVQKIIKTCIVLWWNPQICICKKQGVVSSHLGRSSSS